MFSAKKNEPKKEKFKKISRHARGLAVLANGSPILNICIVVKRDDGRRVDITRVLAGHQEEDKEITDVPRRGDFATPTKEKEDDVEPRDLGVIVQYVSKTSKACKESKE